MKKRKVNRTTKERLPILNKKVGSSIIDFLSSIKKMESGCWEWLGYCDEHGYGRFGFKREQIRSHQFSWLLFGNSIEDNKVLDHICMNRKCCNPSHLRLVTFKTNVLENSISVSALNKLKTHCNKGHPLTKFFVTKAKDKFARRCEICRREYMKVYSAKYYSKNIEKYKERDSKRKYLEQEK